jgi:hypothetical protein
MLNLMYRANRFFWKIKLFFILNAWGKESRAYWHEEIWLRDPDERYCCNGHLCGCHGLTVRAMFDIHGEAR